MTAFDDTGSVVTFGASTKTPVAANTSFRIQFDRFLLPLTVIRQAICIQHSTATVVTEDQCTAPVSFAVSYDPVTREAIFRLAKPGSAQGLIPLEKGGSYKVSFLPPTSDPAAVGFRAFDGALLIDPPTFEFNVSDAKNPPAEEDPEPSAADAWCGDSTATPPVKGVKDFLGNCTLAGCHLYTNGGPSAAMGLQFLTPELIQRTAINHVAHETQTGEHAADIEAAPDRFGRAMPIIAPNNAGNSYILYKILIGWDGGDTSKPFIDDADERERIRNGVVVGDPMPLRNTKPPATPVVMTGDWLRTMSDWIEGGAAMPGVCH